MKLLQEIKILIQIVVHDDLRWKERKKDRHLRQMKNEKWVTSGGIWTHDVTL